MILRDCARGGNGSYNWEMGTRTGLELLATPAGAGYLPSERENALTRSETSVFT